jgi:REP element-mobilizing transposase RayT
MPINRVNKSVNQGFYFITPTIQNWYYLFDRHHRWQILCDSLKFCQVNKGLKIYAYVFMLNHAHLVIQSPDVIGFLRDFKKFTSKKLIENLREFEPQVLALFKKKQGYQFWMEDNQPKIIETEKFALQKINYIHNNPVVKGYVAKPEYWRWSSANVDSEISVEKFVD